MITGEKVKATIIETYAGHRYLVKLEDGAELKAYLSGKMKYSKVSVSVGDQVDVILDKAGGNATNRIVWRY